MLAIKTAGGITRWVNAPAPAPEPIKRVDPSEILLRNELGAVLRQYRIDQDATLRDIAAKSTIALGYLSEIERGRKEASSEILGQLCAALGVPLSQLLLDTALRISAATLPLIPDTIAGIYDTPHQKAS